MGQIFTKGFFMRFLIAWFLKKKIPKSIFETVLAKKDQHFLLYGFNTKELQLNFPEYLLLVVSCEPLRISKPNAAFKIAIQNLLT